jgi:hypothetical protein
VLDEQIALLDETTQQRLSVSEITELRKKASDAYYSIMKQLASGTDIAFDAERKRLLVSLNSIAKLTDEEFNELIFEFIDIYQGFLNGEEINPDDFQDLIPD